MTMKRPHRAAVKSLRMTKTRHRHHAERAARTARQGTASAFPIPEYRQPASKPAKGRKSIRRCAEKSAEPKVHTFDREKYVLDISRSTEKPALSVGRAMPMSTPFEKLSKPFENLCWRGFPPNLALGGFSPFRGKPFINVIKT
jgi:hypothetical protein